MHFPSWLYWSIIILSAIGFCLQISAHQRHINNLVLCLCYKNMYFFRIKLQWKIPKTAQCSFYFTPATLLNQPLLSFSFSIFIFLHIMWCTMHNQLGTKSTTSPTPNQTEERNMFLFLVLPTVIWHKARDNLKNIIWWHMNKMASIYGK